MTVRSKIIEQAKKKNKEKRIIVDHLLIIRDGLMVEKFHAKVSKYDPILVSDRNFPLFMKDKEIYEATDFNVYNDGLMEIKEYVKYYGLKYNRLLLNYLMFNGNNLASDIDINDLP